MVIPESEVIEMAAQLVTTLPRPVQQDQINELAEFGDQRARAMGASGVTPDFVKGYLLGVQTARVWLSMSPAAVKAGIDF